jgi:zinc transport system substrate-binding protein
LVGLCFVPCAASAGIVTTLPPLAGLVLMLDPAADVQCLLPPGADPHAFQLTPKQVQQMNRADLLLRSSYDDRHWSGIGLEGHTLDLWPGQGHAWLSPAAVRDKLPELAAALQRLAPGRSKQIATALHEAQASCDAVDAAWNRALAPYRKNGVIMQHNAWQAMLKHYGVPVWDVLEAGEHGDEIGPRKLEEALDLLRSHPGVVLWGNRRHTERALQWLQEHRDAGQQALWLHFDPLGDCGMSWTQLMQANLDILGSVSGR